METEIWKDIEGYNLYQISSLGRIKSMKFGKEKILKTRINSNGYEVIHFYKNKLQCNESIHRLVISSFLINTENKKCVNHKNGIKTDNRLENLEWVTHSENMKHSFDTGLRITTENNNLKKNNPSKGKYGKDNHLSKSISQYNTEGLLVSEWGSIIDASTNLGISFRCISACCNGRIKTAGGFIWKFSQHETRSKNYPTK